MNTTAALNLLRALIDLSEQSLAEQTTVDQARDVNTLMSTVIELTERCDGYAQVIGILRKQVTGLEDLAAKHRRDLDAEIEAHKNCHRLDDKARDLRGKLADEHASRVGELQAQIVALTERAVTAESRLQAVEMLDAVDEEDPTEGLPAGVPKCKENRISRPGLNTGLPAKYCESAYCERCATLRQRLGEPPLEPNAWMRELADEHIAAVNQEREGQGLAPLEVQDARPRTMISDGPAS